jgi:GH18 family chitinase
MDREYVSNMAQHFSASGNVVDVPILFSYFSLAVASAENRQTFANNILTMYNQYNLDGVDM